MVNGSPVDRIAATREALDPFVANLARRPEVEGVVVLSSLATTGQRVTFDEWSDIDLTVWVRGGMRPDEWRPDPRATRQLLVDRLPSWLGNFSFHLPLPWGNVELNVHQRLIEYDADHRTRWDDAMREAHAYTADVVFDRHGDVTRLIDARCRMSDAERLDRLLRLSSRLEWDIRRAPERMVRRGDVRAAHYILSAAIDEVIEVSYVLGGRFVPHRKWRLSGLTRHGLATREEVALLEEAMRVAALSESEFYRRVDVLETLWRRLRRRLPAAMPEDVYHTYSARVSANRQLLPHTVADVVADGYDQQFGKEVYDLTNYLLPDRLEDLATLSDEDVDRLPAPWHGLARSLSDEVRRDLASDPMLRDAPAGPGEVLGARTGASG